MILNGNLALKSVLGSACHWFARSGFRFRTQLIGNLQSYAYTVSGKNVAQANYSSFWQ